MHHINIISIFVKKLINKKNGKQSDYKNGKQ